MRRSSFHVPRSSNLIARYGIQIQDLDTPHRKAVLVPEPTRNEARGTRNATRNLLLLLLALSSASPLRAQLASDSMVRPPSPALVKYGKWALLAAAIGMGVKASRDHNAADRAFNRLTDYCFTQPNGCPRGADGRYLDPIAERDYQASIAGDRRARNWLFGGEGALIGAAGLFVWELSRPKSLPRNIPFNPEVRWTPRETQLRGSVRF